MSAVNPEVKPKGVYHMRGGIERYVKTFPNGGFWKGKNYLFDRRMEQVPGKKDKRKLEAEVESKCCICRQKWTSYRGKFKCSRSLCGVPVIVCTSCDAKALKHPKKLNCDLCKEGYRAPDTAPDFVALKRKAESLVQANTTKGPEKKKIKKSQRESKCHSDRLFLARLPLTISKSKLCESLDISKEDVKVLHWLTDKSSGAFYGSCVLEITSAQAIKDIVEKATSGGGIKIERKKTRVSFASLKEGEEWPPKDYVSREFPPVGR
jgi:hypothetical protein